MIEEVNQANQEAVSAQTDEVSRDTISTAEAVSSDPVENLSVQEDTSFSTLLSSLPEELRADPSLQNIKDSKTLVKNYINAQKMIGNSVRIPKADDPQEMKDAFFSKIKDIPGVMKVPSAGNKEEQDAFFSALGRPVSAEAYNFTTAEDVPNNEALTTAFKDLSYNIGLSQNQANAIAEWQLDLERQHMQANQQEVEKTMSFLQKEWGQATNDKIESIKELINSYSSKFPEHAAQLQNDRVMNNPVVLMMAAELAKTYKETGALRGGKSLQSALTPEEAREKILEVRTNPDLLKAYMDDRHPGHKEIVAKMQEYYNASHS